MCVELFTGVVLGLSVVDKSSSGLWDTKVKVEQKGWILEWEKGSGDGGGEELMLVGKTEGFSYSR